MSTKLRRERGMLISEPVLFKGVARAQPISSICLISAGFLTGYSYGAVHRTHDVTLLVMHDHPEGRIAAVCKWRTVPSFLQQQSFKLRRGSRW
ncbi:hypothetical protein BDV98DRAFT_574523 [Pterulicium gracile]|uniref:Uncharacterized protein n=1 Tax=Pterulicium gracile TaxID=1884261 RepID=A0A5C3Q7C3_9AGAR|nr:hypothetical protein BDV98DRAFT_574523 [Pterula gracilis]